MLLNEQQQENLQKLKEKDPDGGSNTIEGLLREHGVDDGKEGSESFAAKEKKDRKDKDKEDKYKEDKKDEEGEEENKISLPPIPVSFISH